ncbi:hypothetical protein [Gordonia sp. CPCC 205333]|uniref:hypothetical protein n=1 Tax=Gordonia sp. CPCC 205333 TaxID=3140790 RepID=UPI003AF33685
MHGVSAAASGAHALFHHHSGIAGQLDDSDMSTLQMLRAQRAVESTLRIEHAVGRIEPALWPRTSSAAPSSKTG